MKKILFNNFFAKFAIVALAALAGGAMAANPDAINYPVKELGNCGDKAACKAYCDNEENIDACLVFASKHNLMSKDELSRAEKFLEAGKKGPGGCSDRDSCKQYCDDMGHLEECVAFAEENGLLPPDELEKMKKVQAAIAKGVMPPACKSKKQCDVYCEDPAHMEECIDFAIKAGFMQDREMDDARKMLAAVKKGAKMPACKGKEECDAYCSQEEHYEECTAFAEAAGFMTGEEAAMARKTKGKGPGGCRNREECDAFCNNPANEEICFNFGKENGLIPQEDMQKMQEGAQMIKQVLAQAPQEVIACLKEKLGPENIEKIQNGTFMANQNTGDKMKECFEKMGPPAGGSRDGGEMMPPMPNMPPMPDNANFTGPGGCKGPEECKAYCENHMDECKNFRPEGGMNGAGPNIPDVPSIPSIPNPPENFNPGGDFPPQGGQNTGAPLCGSPEECKALCQTYPEKCANMRIREIPDAPRLEGMISDGQFGEPPMQAPPVPQISPDGMMIPGLPPMPGGGDASKPSSLTPQALMGSALRALIYLFTGQ